MTHPKINELITAAKCLIREGALADRFRELANAAEEELKAIPADPHLNHIITGHRVELDHRGTITVDGLTYSVAFLGGGIATGPGQWCQIRHRNDGLVVTTAREQVIADPYTAPLRAELKRLEQWFDTDPEIMAAMDKDTRADHVRQLALIRSALAGASREGGRK